MVKRVLTLDGLPVALRLEPIYWELLQARSVEAGLSMEGYLERNAPTRTPDALARWIRTSCVNDLRERMAAMRRRFDRIGGGAP